jgi:hypothetical protein
MNGSKLIGLVAAADAVALGTTTAGASFFSDRGDRGEFVKPCSLDGVNPIHHPEIFGNPAAARSFGFVRCAMASGV